MSFQRKDIGDARLLSNNSGKSDGRNANGTHCTIATSVFERLTPFLGSRTGFRTDAAISNSRGGVGRDLQRWEPDTKVVDAGLTLERSSDGSWDQFKVNERLFGLTTDYDESIYTTTIDKSHPNYQQRMAAADKKAREIERSVATTSHVAEERIMDFVGGDDERNEEDKYVADESSLRPHSNIMTDIAECEGMTRPLSKAGRTSIRPLRDVLLQVIQR